MVNNHGSHNISATRKDDFSQGRRTAYFTNLELGRTEGRSYKTDEVGRHSPLQLQLALVKADLERSNQQVQRLTQRLQIAQRNQSQTMKTSKDFSTIQLKKFEPSFQSSTYLLPTRERSARIDKFTTAIPFSILAVLFGISLASAVALATPSVSLWVGITPFILLLVRGLFITVAISTAISFMLELVQAQKTA